jgi:hypothetical protein
MASPAPVRGGKRVVSERVRHEEPGTLAGAIDYTDDGLMLPAIASPAALV